MKAQMAAVKAQMHLDGCHFFAWVYEKSDGRSELTWYERAGDDLAMHADHDCERCEALLGGATSRESRATIELPEASVEAFVAVIVKCAEFEAAAAA